MAKLRKGQEFAILKSPQRSRTHNNVVKVSKKKDEYTQTVAFTNDFELVFLRSHRKEMIEHEDRVVNAAVFPLHKIQRK